MCKIDIIMDMYVIMMKNDDEEYKKILFLYHKYVN